MFVAVAVEEADELVRGGRIGDEEVALVVEREAAAVEVGRADERVEAIDHHDFAVVEAALVDIHFHAGVHQFVHVVLHDARRDGDI